MKNLSILLMLLILSGGTLAQSSRICRTCLPEGIWFSTQTQIDSFPVNYPGCSGIEGFVVINGSDITNLDGLAGVTSIAGGLSIYSNNALTDITALENLTSIGGRLCIYKNNKLISLEGLDNIHYQSINDLIIIYNESLSQCAITSICAYLFAPAGWIQIGHNAPGCNSEKDIETSCELTDGAPADSGQMTQSISSTADLSIQLP
jgi:hypothetical protein